MMPRRSLGRTYSIVRRKGNPIRAGVPAMMIRQSTMKPGDIVMSLPKMPVHPRGVRKVELEKGFFHIEQRLNLNVMRDDRRLLSLEAMLRMLGLDMKG